MTAPNNHRLPTDVRPDKYDVTLEPDLERFTFSGKETVSLQVAAPTSRIELNAAELVITSAEMTLPDGSVVKASSITTDEGTERASFTFDREFLAGAARLHLAFTGTLNDQLRGFYRSEYEGPDGKPRHLATTQFEATDARRAFPCWDEPSAKAIFEVTLIVPDGSAAISNMPIAEESAAAGGKRTVRFEPTPKMSTYLLALLVGDMACVEATAKNGTLVRVWTTRGKEEQGRFALENSVALLAYLNDYFGIPYPLPKLDHIAVPDFAAGAMENWGAITYRETALLFDPENSAAQARQRILEVVAHEMAHMWFGDLVTMEWWDDLWLNESFASWMGDKAVDHLYPEWQMWTQFVSHDTNSGLGLDGLRNSHPVVQTVNDPAEIRELFDAISYSKGGAVLRMIEDYLGEETFRQGLHDYLDSHAYGNARGAELWSALGAISGKPVPEITGTWLDQMGYPVLDVKVTGADTLAISQGRFLYDHLTEEGPQDSSLWQVPVGIVRQGHADKVTSLTIERRTTMPLPSAGPEAWTKVNAGQTGFFRVNYTPDDWQRLRGAVESMELPATDRLGLQNDAYALMRAGYADATAFLSLAQAYVSETDATVWSDLATNLKGLEGLLLDQPYLEQYRTFARRLFSDIAGRVSWYPRPGEGHLDSLLRSTVLGQYGAYGDRGTVAEAQRHFDRYLSDPGSLRPDLRGVALNLAAQEGNASTYESLWTLEKAATLSEEKTRALGALGRFKDPELLRDVLGRSIMPEHVRSQDTILVVSTVAANQYGRDLAWDFIKDNWDEMDRRYGKGGFAIMRLVSITGGFTTAARGDEVERFFDTHPAPSAARTVQQSLERIRLNVRWLERNSEAIGAWLAKA